MPVTFLTGGRNISDAPRPAESKTGQRRIALADQWPRACGLIGADVRPDPIAAAAWVEPTATILCHKSFVGSAAFPNGGVRCVMMVLETLSKPGNANATPSNKRSPSLGTAEEARPAALPEQRTEPAGLGRAVAAEIGFISEDPFNLALGSQALPSARGPEPEVLNREIDGLLEAISHDSFVFRGEGAELAKAPLPPQQPDNVRGRAISARFLPLWRIGLGRLVSRRSDERCDLICPDLSKVL